MKKQSKITCREDKACDFIFCLYRFVSKWEKLNPGEKSTGIKKPVKLRALHALRSFGMEFANTNRKYGQFAGAGKT